MQKYSIDIANLNSSTIDHMDGSIFIPQRLLLQEVLTILVHLVVLTSFCEQVHDQSDDEEIPIVACNKSYEHDVITTQAIFGV